MTRTYRITTKRPLTDDDIFDRSGGKIVLTVLLPYFSTLPDLTSLMLLYQDTISFGSLSIECIRGV